MRRKAHLADQTKPGLPVVDPTSVLQEVGAARADRDAWTCVPGKNRVSAWPIVSVGLLRQLAGQTHQQIALALSLPQSSAQRRAREHRRLMRVDVDYARHASELASACLSVGESP